eukprot:1674505-Prymnesium_polylepis.2
MPRASPERRTSWVATADSWPAPLRLPREAGGRPPSPAAPRAGGRVVVQQASSTHPPRHGGQDRAAWTGAARHEEGDQVRAEEA